MAELKETTKSFVASEVAQLEARQSKDQIEIDEHQAQITKLAFAMGERATLIADLKADIPAPTIEPLEK